MKPAVQTISQKQGSVVAVLADMILVRYDGKGVLFKNNLLSRHYKHDDIVQFSAKKATAPDIEVGSRLSEMAGYEIGWLGTEIKFIKVGRRLRGEGIIINIPEESNSAQYMFVDWRFTKNPPKALNSNTTTNVFVTRAAVLPPVTKLTELFRAGQRVKFVAREQAPNERGVCWRSIVVTDENHEIALDTCNPYGRQNYKVVPKAGATPSAPKFAPMGQKTASSVWNNADSSSRASSSKDAASPSSSSSGSAQRPLCRPTRPTPSLTATAPTSRTGGPFHVQKPPSVDGFDYWDTSKEACTARFKHFVDNYRAQNPKCMFSEPSFEGLLRIKYLQHITDEMNAIRIAEESSD
ncbi:unnamed protein product [Caenorhabditis sp. 36 PRJEB53466]|nr:unnamed protein product [Caenorhabditis sp. 36 PRJEB53466]